MVVSRKVASFGKIDDFSCVFSKWATFCNFLLKSWPKRRNMVVSSKSCKFLPNGWFFVLFREISHFLQLFAEKLTKTPKHGSLLEKLLVLAKSMIFRAFSRNGSLFAETSSIWPKVATFPANYHVSAFLSTFQQKGGKSGSFREKWRKIIDLLAKTNNFSNKLPCFGVLVSFSAKSCKKYCRSISGTSYNCGVRDLNLLLSPLPRLR